MEDFSGLVIGLSALFGCFLLGIVAELYYLFWWKKRETQTHQAKHGTEIFSLLRWKKPKPNTQELPDVNSSSHEQDPELGEGKDSVVKGLGEEGVDSEIMRLHNLCGPPRFLFTISEETREDLDSDDGRSRGERSRKGSRTRSFSDVIVALDTPFSSSPPHGFKFNPLFESSSPPPKFKFLRDAEEKLMRKLMEEAEKMSLKIEDSVAKGTPNSTQIAVVVGKSKERGVHHQLSQVLPLDSSPSTFASL